MQVLYELLAVGFVATSGALSIYLDPGVSLALSGVSLVLALNVFTYSSYRGRSLPILIPALPATVLVYSICQILELPNYFVDSVILFTVLATLIFHWGVGRVRELFKPVVPIATLAGVLAGIWVGSPSPLKFSLTPLLEVVAYAVVRDGSKVGQALPYSLAILVALNLNPATYVSPVLLVVSSLLYLAKVVVIEVRPSIAPYLVGLDTLVRPTLAGVL